MNASMKAHVSIRPRNIEATRVLIAYASKYGSTSSIAREVGKVLGDADFEVHVLPVDRVADLETYDAVVLGSALYYGHWMNSATQFIDLNQETLQGRAVWLFPSGPVGEQVPSPKDLLAFDEIVKKTGALDHAIFKGRLQRDRLTCLERVVTRVARAPAGDFREWDHIDSWAASIAAALPKMTSTCPS